MRPANPDKEFVELLKRARAIFKGPQPESNVSYVIEGVSDPEFTQEIEYFLVGREWLDIIQKDVFTIPIRYQREFGIKYIPMFLAREWFIYFLPGFLLHFMAAGTYDDVADIYYVFITRLQPDNDEVVKFGGPDAYFTLEATQKQFCCDALSLLKARYGDRFAKFSSNEVEHPLLKDVSISRAIELYWH